MIKEHIVIVGTGVAGLTAAHLLKNKYQLTLIEKNNYIGGHTNTILVKDKQKEIAVDTGFIVMNHRNYPLFSELLRDLGVELQDSNMSFGHYDRNSNLFYNTDNLKGLFAQKKNIINPKFYWLLFEIVRFFKKANSDLLKEDKLEHFRHMTLGEYLKKYRFSQNFIDNYLVPMGSAIWSTPTDQMLDFPLLSFLRFYKNHGLLSISDHPQWRTVAGGSHTYVKRIIELFNGDVISGDGTKLIRRHDNYVNITLNSGRVIKADKVIIATHADEALCLLDDPSEEEKALLGKWSYSINQTFLHTDTSILPPSKDGWASWNFCRSIKSNSSEGLTLTYNMNKLQNLNTSNQYLVTLNPSEPINPQSIIKRIDYTHPKFNFESINTQKNLHLISGINRTYFCGSYHGNGFHEDAVRSSIDICKKLGVFFP